MGFRRIKGLPGRVYVPDPKGGKKHNCSDCYFCQWCSDNRCRTCLKGKSEGGCCKKTTETGQ